MIWLTAAVTLLLLAASPILFMQTGSTGMTATGYPDDQYAKQGWDVLDRDFSLGKANPVQIVVDGPADAAAVKDGVARLQAALKADGRFGPAQVAVSEAGDLTAALGAARRRPRRRGDAGRRHAPARARRAGRLRRHRRPRVRRRHDRRRRRLPRLLRLLAADRAGRRPQPQLRAPARRLPLDRDPGQGDRS